MSTMRGVYAANSSPYSLLYLLKLSLEGNPRVSDEFPCWCMKTFGSFTWLMARVGSLAVAGLESLCPVLGVLGWPLFAPQ